MLGGISASFPFDAALPMQISVFSQVSLSAGLCSSISGLLNLLYGAGNICFSGGKNEIQYTNYIMNIYT
jgi:hypothetical protein